VVAEKLKTGSLDGFARRRLLEGLDDIELTLRYADAITGYETSRPPWLPALGRTLT
jgi:3-isopropylmalate/(R)-2-methylmalate dehydratase small subunit